MTKLTQPQEDRLHELEEEIEKLEKDFGISMNDKSFGIPETAD